MGLAATALPPNGTDQRLLHCSLPLCLCSEFAHAHRYTAGLDRVRNRCPARPIKHGTNRLPSLALATKNAEGHKGVFLINKLINNKGPEQRSGVASTSHRSQHQSLWKSSPSRLRTCGLDQPPPPCGPSPSQPLWKHSLFKPRVGEACLNGVSFQPFPVGCSAVLC